MLYSDKLNRRAADRLYQLYVEDQKENDGWEMVFPWNKPLSKFLLNCDKHQLRVIIALSEVGSHYAFEVLGTLFFNANVEFPFETVEDIHIETQDEILL